MVESNNNKQYLGRGLHSAKWEKALSEGGKLYGLLELVKSDDDLVIEIRNDYFNVYYKGGNMIKVLSENSFDFDSNYYKGFQRPYFEADEKEEERKERRKILLTHLKKERNYSVFIREMKKIMEDYWIWLKEERKKSLHEKDVQHALCINNTENSEYTIIDVEFQVSTDAEYKYDSTYSEQIYSGKRFVAHDKKSPRFDIIAVRNSDHQLCVIELKSGDKALYGKSGIGDHADSFECSINRNPQVFMKEIMGVIEDKIKYGLLSQDFIISMNNPEFMYAYSFQCAKTSGDSLNKEEQMALFMEELRHQKCEHYRVMFLEENDYTLSDK